MRGFLANAPLPAIIREDQQQALEYWGHMSSSEFVAATPFLVWAGVLFRTALVTALVPLSVWSPGDFCFLNWFCLRGHMSRIKKS